MRRLRTVIVALAAVGGGVACSPIYYERPLPNPVSRPPIPSDGYFRAGFGKVDFTPPPGVGLAGNGPDGLRSDGWRLHLFARSLVMEDSTGERFAFVVVDLPHVSVNLHREVAGRIAATTGIGADRLVISATHTHSGPGHFYAEKAYNDQSSRVTGYDPSVERLLVDRIALSVSQAASRLRQAWAGWAVRDYGAVTRNRSITAYCANAAEAVPIPCGRRPDSADLAGRAVNRQLAVLRIDTLPPEIGRTAAGFLAVYSIHGTGNSNATTLLDGDIHGLAMARLEQDLGGPQSIGLLLNGTEGDVSPAIDPAARCPRPAVGIAGPITMVRGIDRRYDFIRGSDRARERCLRLARREVSRVADSLRTAITTELRELGPDRMERQLSIRRAFTTVQLTADPGLCPPAAVGTAAIGGAEDAPSRVWKWEPLPFARLGFREGAVERPPKGCHREKKRVGALQAVLTGSHGLPETAQLTVVRLGDRITVATAPAELTTAAGLEVRRTIATHLGGSVTGADGVVVIGLANGFLQYINTDSEYRVQSYEGGSNLYGPKSAEVLTSHFGLLAEQLRGQGASPPAEVLPIAAYPGTPRVIMPEPVGPAWTGDRNPRISCRDNLAIRVVWSDQAPGWIRPSDGNALVRFITTDGEAGDGDADVTIRDLGGRGSRHRWEATWLPGRPNSRVDAVLPSQRGFPEARVSLPDGCGRAPSGGD